MIDYVRVRDTHRGDIQLGVVTQGFAGRSEVPGRKDSYIEVPLDLIRDARLTALAFRLYLLLENERQRLGVVEVTYSLARMKAEVSMSEKAIRTALSSLRDVGLLAVRTEYPVPTMSVNHYRPTPMEEAEFVRRPTPAEQDRYDRN